MRKKLLVTVLLVSVLISLCSCGKYDAIPPSEDDLKVVGSIADYDLYYDELRFSVMNAKALMEQYYGISWDDPNDAAAYSDELYNSVLSGIRYNYAVQILFRDLGYEIDEPTIQDATQEYIEGLIDELGGRGAYIDYLSESYLTDRVLRFNVSISHAENQMVHLLNYQGALDEYVDFDIAAISNPSDPFFDWNEFIKAMDFLYSGKCLIKTEHIVVPVSVENASDVAAQLFESAQKGTPLSELADPERDISQETFYQVEGERDERYFSSAQELDENDITLLHTEKNLYVIKRLPLDADYVSDNYYDIIIKYLSIKVSEKTDEYAETLEVILSDFGKSLDFVKMK